MDIAPRIHDWARGEPRYSRKLKGKVQRQTGLYVSNVPGEVKVVIANRNTGDMIEFPDDAIAFVFINREAAEKMRDDLLDPSEFPEILDT